MEAVLDGHEWSVNFDKTMNTVVEEFIPNLKKRGLSFVLLNSAFNTDGYNQS